MQKIKIHSLIISLFTVLLLVSQNLAVKAGVTAENAENLIGTWKIYDASNNELASFEVTLAITKQGVANFSYKNLGAEASEDENLKGLMINQDQIIVEFLTPGQSQTYIFDIDFPSNGGPGILIQNTLADCSTVGVDTDLVKNKFEKRLASSSLLCTEEDDISSMSEVKLVKDGTDPSTISTTASIDSSINNNLSTVADQIEGAWRLRSTSKNSVKFLVKDTEAHFLGYKFTYRIIGNKTKLKNLTESNFKSSERTGIILDEHMVLNTSFFKKKNSLNIIDLNSKRKKGSGYFIQTPNGDCFPSKSGSSSTRVCTPNYDTSLASSISRRSSKARAARINTKTKVSF